jgi:methylmalonyl-CoA mutase N-terminal domain/subunit
VLGGTQSLHTNSFDEALALPTEESARIALRTQQVIASESNVIQTVDPLAGSYFVESLTDEIEKRTWEYLDQIEKRGGTIACIESGYIQNEILDSAYSDQQKIDSGRLKVVGVNCFTEKEAPGKLELLKISPEIERQCVERVRAYRAKRSAATYEAGIRALKDGAKGNANIQGLVLDAVRAQATLGEVADALRSVFGEFKEYSGF